MSADLSDILKSLEELLTPDSYSDTAFNGLQLDGGEDTVTKIALAVDSGEAVIEAAIAMKAQLLIVHHGMLWGKVEPIITTRARVLRMLLENKCSLYASHLPLDGNFHVGNAAELARFLGCIDIEPAFEHGGMPVGVTCAFPQPCTLDEVLARAASIPGFSRPLALPFGKKACRHVGIVTGSGSSAVTEASQVGMELFISGEPKQEVYHRTRELEINALFLGHYATETFGVRALGRFLTARFSVESHFIDIPTGI